MSSKRKNTSRNIPALPSSPECSETSGNEREIEDFSLTFRQHAVLPTIAVSHSIAQAARDSGIAESTLRRWLTDPSFRTALTHVRQERQALIAHQAQAALSIGMSITTELAIQATDPAIQLRAARSLLEYGVKLLDLERISDDLQDLHEAVYGSDNSNQQV